jgi:hypothetical protein
MNRSFIPADIAELLMGSTSPNQIWNVKRGECPEAIYSKNIILYIYYLWLVAHFCKVHQRESTVREPTIHSQSWIESWYDKQHLISFQNHFFFGIEDLLDDCIKREFWKHLLGLEQTNPNLKLNKTHEESFT